MEKIQRYELESTPDYNYEDEYCGDISFMEKSDEGEYVLYEDIKHLLSDQKEPNCCRKSKGLMDERDEPWNYCPVCGKKLGYFKVDC